MAQHDAEARLREDPFLALGSQAFLEKMTERQVSALPASVRADARAQLAERKKAAKSAALRKPASEDAWTKLIGKLSDVERAAVAGALDNVENAAAVTYLEENEDGEPFEYDSWGDAA